MKTTGTIKLTIRLNEAFKRFGRAIEYAAEILKKSLANPSPCAKCDFFETYIDEHLLDMDLEVRPDNCVCWLCNNGACPHDAEATAYEEWRGGSR